MIALPFIVFLLAAVLAKLRASGWREAMIIAAIALAIGVAAVTEIASLFRILNFSTIFSVWAMAAWTLGFLAFRAVRSGRISFLPTVPISWWWSCLVLPLPVFGAALLWPPNNYDCMVYHLPRVFEWAQNGSVAHYSTPIFRQLYQPPLFEYILLHLRLLGGSVFSFNLLSACSLVGSGLASSLIVERGASQKWAGPLAFTLVVTLPIAVLQGSDPKNDILLGFWCLASLHFILDFRVAGKISSLACAIFALALAVLTKGTAWIMLPAPGLLILAAPNQARRNATHRPGLIWIALAIALAAGTVLPHHIRNQATFGSPLGISGAKGEEQYGNATHTLGTVASNVLRNLAIELQTPWTEINVLIQEPVVVIHHALHLDINSPSTTWPGTTFTVLAPARPHEDLISNPLATLLLLAAGLTLALSRSCRRSPLAVILGTTTLLSFLLFCTLLRWQPWHSRLLTPIFFIGLTFVTLIMAKAWHAWLRFFIAGLTISSAAMVAWSNESRPLSHFRATLNLSVDRRMFQNNLGLFSDYREAAQKILTDRPKTLGLIFRRNDWEFPLWYWLVESECPPTILHWGDAAAIRRPPGQQFFPMELLVAAENRSQLTSLPLDHYVLVFANRSFEIYRDKYFPIDVPSAQRTTSDLSLQTDFTGDNWYSEERFADERWRWAKGDAAIRIVPGDRPVDKAMLRAQLSSFEVARHIEILSDQGEILWAGEVLGDARVDVVISHIGLNSIGTTLRFKTMQPVMIPGRNDSRILAYAVYNLQVSPESSP